MLIDLEELAGEIASKVDGAGLTPVIEKEGSVRPKLTYSIFPIWDDNAREQFEFAPGH